VGLLAFIINRHFDQVNASETDVFRYFGAVENYGDIFPYVIRPIAKKKVPLVVASLLSVPEDARMGMSIGKRPQLRLKTLPVQLNKTKTKLFYHADGMNESIATHDQRAWPSFRAPALWHPYHLGSSK
jgi:hypothetical protein